VDDRADCRLNSAILLEKTMLTRQLFDPASSSFSYLVIDEPSGQAALIDPVREQLERDLTLVRELGAQLRYVLETHTHADHITSAAALAQRTGAITGASELGAACAQLHLRDGDTLQLGTTAIRTLATPGHTSDSLSFHVHRHIFTGDTLLVRGTGRTDFQNGDALTLYESITNKLFALPNETLVWPGHDYQGHRVSSIGEERRYNPRLAGKSRQEFAAIMRELKLAPPKLLRVAVPANLDCGRDAMPHESRRKSC
jgi:glyoxylase-like metal-dependent hydrolase (beta-lactamase superfamily II)